MFIWIFFIQNEFQRIQFRGNQYSASQKKSRGANSPKEIAEGQRLEGGLFFPTSGFESNLIGNLTQISNGFGPTRLSLPPGYFPDLYIGHRFVGETFVIDNEWYSVLALNLFSKPLEICVGFPTKSDPVLDFLYKMSQNHWNLHWFSYIKLAEWLSFVLDFLYKMSKVCLKMRQFLQSKCAKAVSRCNFFMLDVRRR